MKILKYKPHESNTDFAYIDFRNGLFGWGNTTKNLLIIKYKKAWYRSDNNKQIPNYLINKAIDKYMLNNKIKTAVKSSLVKKNEGSQQEFTWWVDK